MDSFREAIQSAVDAGIDKAQEALNQYDNLPESQQLALEEQYIMATSSGGFIRRADGTCIIFGDERSSVNK